MDIEIRENSKYEKYMIILVYAMHVTYTTHKHIRENPYNKKKMNKIARILKY